MKNFKFNGKSDKPILIKEQNSDKENLFKSKFFLGSSSIRNINLSKRYSVKHISNKIRDQSKEILGGEENNGESKKILVSKIIQKVDKEKQPIKFITSPMPDDGAESKKDVNKIKLMLCNYFHEKKKRYANKKGTTIATNSISNIVAPDKNYFRKTIDKITINKELKNENNENTRTADNMNEELSQKKLGKKDFFLNSKILHKKLTDKGFGVLDKNTKENASMNWLKDIVGDDSNLYRSFVDQCNRVNYDSDDHSSVEDLGMKKMGNRLNLMLKNGYGYQRKNCMDKRRVEMSLGEVHANNNMNYQMLNKVMGKYKCDRVKGIDTILK